jgi:hypothetical protein
MTVPSVIRAAGALRVKEAVMQPLTTAKHTTPDLSKKLQRDLAPKIVSPVTIPSTPTAPDPMSAPSNIGKMPTLPKIKLAGPIEAGLKIVSMFGDDAVELALRRAVSVGNTAASVPVMNERVHMANDPTYTPDPGVLAAKKLLSIANKFAGDGNAQGFSRVENRGGTTDQPHDQTRATAGTGALTTHDAASQAFNRLRAFTKADTASFSSETPMSIG